MYDQMADRIVRMIGPKSVLDAGCALGMIVEGLRNRGVDAFGIDISTFAIENTHPEIKPYCWVGSILDPLPQRYDLIVTIETLEHLHKKESEQAVANLCQYTDDILFSSSPLDYKEPTHFNVQPPEYWVSLFAQYDFYRDVDFDASFITPWAVRFRRTKDPLQRIIANYERKYWQVTQELQGLREINNEQRLEISKRDKEIQKQKKEVHNLELELSELRSSHSWQLISRFQRTRERFIPVGSGRERFFYSMWRAKSVLREEGFVAFLNRIPKRVAWEFKIKYHKVRFRFSDVSKKALVDIDELKEPPAVQVHSAQVDIVICIHNALTDVKYCLNSVINNTTQPFSLILVDDGSDPETRDYLADFSFKNGCTLLRNEQAEGYTFAANHGLRKSKGDYVVLLNSDTIVTSGWLDRMVACAEQDPKIGLVGPLSNQATWQSIPKLFDQEDWAENPLPEDITIAQMGEWVSYYSRRLYPKLQFLNGFCMMIRRQVIDEIGFFDEDHFGKGYSEENDYCLRAREAGWYLALADDVYIFHGLSRSYSPESRERLNKQAMKTLAQKHGQQAINHGTAFNRENRVLQGIRAHSQYFVEREQLIDVSRQRCAGRRILFILPVGSSGGGANVVVLTAELMRRMGIDAHILNLPIFRNRFEQSYPGLGVPVTYAGPENVTEIATRYDAVVATLNTTVSWVVKAVEKNPKLVVGYYIQDYEPYFYEPNSKDYRIAFDSYSLFPNLVRCCTTEWIYDQIQKHHKIPAHIIGGAFDTDLFWPRPRKDPEWPDRPLRIAAMIRPASQRRNPLLHMEVLQRISKRYGPGVEIKLFGTSLDDPGFAPLPQNFPWEMTGKLRPKQVANLLNQSDIFVDFSTFQALGITALESMACGLAVIVPKRGGAATFGFHEKNCLFVDTDDLEDCFTALQRLIEDHDLRKTLQRNAIFDAPKFHLESPTTKLLEAMFPNSGS
jgi:GT2 family glycosyltransferase